MRSQSSVCGSRLKRALCILICMAMLVSTFYVSAFAFEGTYKDGTYTGSGVGYDSGTVTLNVTISDGKVTNIETADASSQTQSIWNKAETIYSSIIESQSTDVDAVSGATLSCDGIKQAVNDALTQASQAAADEDDTSIFSSGSGTESDPYIIRTASQLANFAASVDGGETYADKYISLGADIDLSSIESWNPIGTEAQVTAKNGNTAYIFAGTFDGCGYTVSNMKIAAAVSAEANYGLFSTVASTAVIKNLNVSGADINVSSTAGALRAAAVAAASMSGSGLAGGAKFDCCSASGTINADNSAAALVYGGGIVGNAGGSTAITNSYTDVDITAYSRGGTNSAYAGGIAGITGANTLLLGCASLGDLTAVSPKSSNFGGMAGGMTAMLAGMMYNCYASGNVTYGHGGSSHDWAGILAGQVTVSGMEKQNDGSYLYKDTGAYRAYGYYNSEAVLSETVYDSDLNPTTTVVETVGKGSTTGTTSYDTAFAPESKTAAEMQTKEFADSLNDNIYDITKLLSAYGVSGIEIKEWKLDGESVVPTGDTWVNGVIDASIFDSGSGTEDDPYVIKTEAQLRAFAASLNSKIDYTGLYVVLGDNIDVSSSTWTPIGGSEYAFNGTFDGMGYTISGISIGTAESPLVLDPYTNIYIGLFGVLYTDAVVQNVNLDNVGIYTTIDKYNAYVGGIAGLTQSGDSGYDGSKINNCTVSGTISHTAEAVDNAVGNQFVGGLVGMQYKGATINSSADVTLSCIVNGEALAEVGGLVGLNNRGLVANCYSLGDVYGSGSRENGLEGMAVVSNLVAVQAGALVGCYGSGDTSTKEYSTYVGMVSGWITGLGKSYNCYYDLDSSMVIGKDDPNINQVVSPVESVGTLVSSGVDDTGNAYTGGLVTGLTGYNSENYSAVADALNAEFGEYAIDISLYGVGANELKKWIYDGSVVTFGDEYAAVTYKQPDCETVQPEETVLNDGTWYGRDEAKTTVVSVTVEGGEVTSTAVLSGESSGTAYDEALEKAKTKSSYNDIADYSEADPTKFGGGSGTESDPYLIENEEQLRYLSSSINEDVSWSGVYFKQTADIELTDGDWMPIGRALEAEVNGKKATVASYPFRGNYDGGCHSITGLTIGTEEAPADQMTSGLFGFTAGELTTNDEPTDDQQTVTLKNIYLEDAAIYVSTRYETYTGLLVGNAQMGIYIDNCSVSGEIGITTSESFARAGGIAGNVLRGAVTNVQSDVYIEAETDTSNVYAGGLYAMDNRVTTINAYALGSVYGNSSNNNKVHIGGLTGQAGGVHINCYASGDVVSEKTTTDVGGLNGRLAAIAAEYNCCYSSDSLQQQGDTANENKANGVTFGYAENVTAKTYEELASSEFAALLNENVANNDAALTAVNTYLSSLSESGYTHLNYYKGNELYGWELSDEIVKLSNPEPTEEFSGYILMNIPYEVFYGAENVSKKSDGSVNMNYDAITSATNKVGNYGKSGGAYHTEKTAEIADDGTVTAVGGVSGAANKGVTWAVKVEDESVLETLKSLGGTEITDESSVTVATLGRGQTSSTELTGYKALNEAPDYSYYVLSEAPAYYSEMTIVDGKPVFTATVGTAETKDAIEPGVTYGSNWGDVQLDLSAATDASDKQINAVVLTATDKDGNTVTAGLMHLYNVWSSSSMAWKNSQIEGLNGATITNIRYYCNSSTSDSTGEPTYYVYDYPMNLQLLPAYDGETSAVFDSASQITISGLPDDIKNAKAQVYHTTGGRNAVYTYLTPLTVDPSDDDIDPISVDVTDGKIAITPGSVTNNAGTTKTYGEPIDGTTYTIALSSDNYAPMTLTATYTAAEGIKITGVTSGSTLSISGNIMQSGEGEISGVVIAAAYDAEGVLIGTNTAAAADNIDLTIENAESAKTVTLMWWDGIDTMIPMAEAVSTAVE